MRFKRMMGLVLVLLPMMIGAVIVPNSPMVDMTGSPDNKTVELGTGETIEVAPDEVVHEYSLSDVPTTMTGTGDPLLANESGIRIDSFTDQRMDYDPGTSSITTANLSVPLGNDWESYAIFA
ncbi:MAG: hypothetical protein DRP09_11860, partial [Candidatus Thorarchaeota archaeon]